MRRKKRQWHSFKKNTIPYFFVLPVIVLFVSFRLYPMAGGTILSFQKFIITLGKPAEYIGLENYQKIAGDAIFWTSLWNTLYYTAGVVPLSIVIGLGFALILNQPLRFRMFFRTVFYLPVVVSFVAMGVIWSMMFARDIGVVDYFMSRLGLSFRSWLQNPNLAMPAIITTSLWRQIGYAMIIFLAGLQSIPAEYYEAARVDGARPYDCFRYLTLPLLKPVTLFLTIICIIDSFKVFDQVYVMTKGGPGYSTTTLVQYLYQTSFKYYRMGYASAIAIVLLALILTVTFVQWKLFRGGAID